jgi:hypothetical protein
MRISNFNVSRRTNVEDCRDCRQPTTREARPMTHFNTARLVLAAVLATVAVLAFCLVLWLMSLEGQTVITMTDAGRRFLLTDLLAAGALCGLFAVLLWQRRLLGVLQFLLALLTAPAILINSIIIVGHTLERPIEGYVSDRLIVGQEEYVNVGCRTWPPCARNVFGLERRIKKLPSVWKYQFLQKIVSKGTSPIVFRDIGSGWINVESVDPRDTLYSFRTCTDNEAKQ